MTLYDPTRHVTPPPEPWDPGRAQAWLERWAADALSARSRHGWPVHPRDAEGAPGPGAPRPYQGLYFGACGVWLALARAAAAGFCSLPMSLPEIFDEVLEAYLRSPDDGQRVPSWFLGESALLTVCCLARPDARKADRLAEIIRDNRDNPAREALWGAPGTMLAALFLHEATGDERWAALIRDSAAALWESWTHDEALGVWLWEQDLYGRRVRYLGAAHGWAGNLYALWRAHALLSPEQRSQLRARTLEGLGRLATIDGELANWPAHAGPPSKPLLQWCHGAPGIITSLRHAALPEALPLLLKGARSIVAAGPLAKGVALCHGTDGNGAALLEIYRRTQDASWLDRARAFATWAIAQSEAEHHRVGQWRYSLLTGDAGLACYLLDCLDGRSRGMPGVDSLW
ncbi:lanthionine synthetase C family protein [Sorangium sp. So ce394]|uniref:lanthionine synthetase C family protein n=1 Tax=Sorangium sp. So ce394 TaxID=3133310 RepID=UPI003F5C1C30